MNRYARYYHHHFTAKCLSGIMYLCLQSVFMITVIFMKKIHAFIISNCAIYNLIACVCVLIGKAIQTKANVQFNVIYQPVCSWAVSSAVHTNMHRTFCFHFWYVFVIYDMQRHRRRYHKSTRYGNMVNITTKLCTLAISIPVYSAQDSRTFYGNEYAVVPFAFFILSGADSFTYRSVGVNIRVWYMFILDCCGI